MKLASLVLILFLPILFLRCIRFAIRCLGKSAINLLSPLVSQVGLEDLKAKQNISLANKGWIRSATHEAKQMQACSQAFAKKLQ